MEKVSKPPYPDFPDNHRLPDLQAYVAEVCSSQGWDKASDLETFLLFSEEIGELAKAIRKSRKLFDEPGKKEAPFEVREEFADVLSYLLDLANRFEVNLAQAFQEKEAVNAKRSWGEKG